MTARERLVSLQRLMLTVVVLRALLIGASVTVACMIVARALVLPPAMPALVSTIGAFVAALVLGRGWSARSLQRVALWVEERHPALRYALVTAAEAPASPDVEREATATPWWDAERRTLLRALLVPTLALLVAVALLAISQRTVRSGALASVTGTSHGS